MKLMRWSSGEMMKYFAIDPRNFRFCFCCFSSLRYSDVSKLKKTDIRDGYFLIATEKTADPLAIDLNNFSQIILDKYKDVEFQKDLALPVISMAKMNEYLQGNR